jgi:Amt family ammonium transporter
MAPLALCGLALLNTGLGRSRSAAQSLLGALCIVAIAAIVFCMLGFSWTAYPGDAYYSLNLGASSWNWIGARPLFLGGMHWTGSPAGFAAAFEALAAGLAALIPWGSGADRWRLGSVCLATAVFVAFAFPLLAHWVWGGGWLATLGSAFHLGAGFVDPGGAATVQVLGGLSALAVVWILGPRRTKFSGSAMPRAIPGHHMIYVLLGCLLMLPGWMAFNSLGAILFASIAAPSLVLVLLNTLLSAAAALLAALLVTALRFRRPDASLCANGWVAGLVVSSAIAPYASPAEALLAGALAGGALPFLVEWLEVYGCIDDPSGAIAVHGISGLWSLFALGLLGGFPPGQMLAQLLGIGTLLGLVFPLLYGMHWLLNKILRYRTSAEGERVGMDLQELGAGAYPEFVIYGDEFLPR